MRTIIFIVVFLLLLAIAPPLAFIYLAIKILAAIFLPRKQEITIHHIYRR